MVYFTCNACGEQLKKPSVEKHYTQKCRQCTMLTCIDCLKDFYGDEYRAHNACMSEEQRYSKEGRAGWDPEKGQGNKGESRQKSWTSNLRAILAETQNIDSDVKNIVNTILDHENIPRKKPKFSNFVKNIMRNRASPHAIDKTWDLFSQALKPPTPPAAKEVLQEKEVEMEVQMEKSGEDTEKKEKKRKKEKKKDKSDTLDDDTEMAQEESSRKKSKKERKKDKLRVLEDEENISETSEKENTVKTTKKKKKKDKNKEVEKDESEDLNKNKKRKRDEEMEVDEDASQPKKTKFDWDEVITSLLMQKEDKEMKLNKLKKKCVNEFFSANEGTHKTPEEVGAKFDKKLKKRKYRLLKDKVKLVVTDEDDEQEAKIVRDVPEPVVEKEAKPVVKNEAKPALSFNQWESSNLGSAAQTEKFRRLMGIKSGPPVQQPQSGKFGVGQRDDRKIFRDLEQGFEKARQAHFGGRCFEQ